jgi:hypothetical protein
MKNSLGIYIEDCDYIDWSQIELIKDFFLEQKDVSDCVIFTNKKSNIHSEYCILDAFYSRFYSGVLLFLKVEDFILNQNHMLSQNIYIMCDIADLIQNNINRSNINNVKLIQTKDNQIRIINNETI